MNVVMIIPTGTGCRIGGHSGDACVVARLLASVSDLLLVHPNVVNGGDINEMPINAWYVEGSILDNVLAGTANLRPVDSNKILVVVNEIHPQTKNCVNAARYSLGMDINTMVLNVPLTMEGWVNGAPTGSFSGVDELIEQVQGENFDALAVHTPINVDRTEADLYHTNGGLNLWGRVEAMVSREIAEALEKPVAHAPMVDDYDLVFIDGYPRLGAEMVSGSYLFSVLKGLHKAPRIGGTFSAKDIDLMVSPKGLWGTPHLACKASHIPILVVEDNKTLYEKSQDALFVRNYLEAAGYIAAMKAGITAGFVCL